MKKPNWPKLASQLQGELHTDELLKRIYATDASVYRRLPAAVAYPKDAEDIRLLLDFASESSLGIIPLSLIHI